MEANGWSVQNSGFEIHLFATSCEQLALEVPVRQVQKKDLLSHEVGIQTELGTQNHVDDPEKNLRKDDSVSYIDDIFINEAKVTTKEMVAHLKEFGLVAKIPESLDGGAVLGLKLQHGASGRLDFHRGNEIPKMKERLSLWELFSMYRKLIGHYPITSWL